jgi:DNA (cytosine-5)-methyltransferase 1
LLDLFAGCGGLTQGFVDTGLVRPVGAIERDPDAASTYALNFGDHVQCADITQWSIGAIPLADVVVGGPPCQGFSTLGTRNAADPRNVLWRHYAHVVARVRPAFFVLENVPRFLYSNDFAALAAEAVRGGVLGRWELEAHVLDAADYGSAQARKRAIVVGRPAGMRRLGVPRASAARRVLADVIGAVDPEVHAVELPRTRIRVSGRDVPGAYKTRDLHVTNGSSQESIARYRAIPPGGGRLDLPDDLKLPAWRGEYRGAADVMGRLRWDRPSVTIRTGFHRPEKGRFLHPVQNRALTHYEAALIQGFPEDFLWCGSKTSIARQIGDAVPVPLAKSVAHHVLAHLA